MHELTISKNILDIIIQQCIVVQCNRVKTIYLEIGQLSTVDCSALQFSFAVIAQGSIAKDAQLAIIPIPGKACCASCQKDVIIKQYFEPCPICGNFALTILEGEELRVKSMEVE